MRMSHRTVNPWRRTPGIGAALIGALLAFSAGAQANTSVNFGAYTGVFRVSGPAQYSHPGSGSAAGVDLGLLADGEYFFDSGASIGNAIAASYFTFTISSDQIVSVSNSAAASIGAGGKTLVLNNCNIAIDPSNYVGRYWLSSYSAGGTQWQNQQTFVLIPGLLYSVDNTSLIGYSAFSFSVDGSGSIAQVLDANGNPTSVPAIANGNTLTLQNVLTQVDPTTYTGSYRVAGVDVTQGGKATITLIPGLLASISASGSGVGTFTPVTGMPQTTVTNGGLTFLVGPPTPPDTTPPTTTVTITPDPSTTTTTGGWYNSSAGAVSVSLSAADNGGSGVKSLEYSTDGGNSWSTYSSSLSYTADGIYTIQYRATDNAGNVEKNADGSYKSVTIKIDKTPPTVTLGAADGLWHNADVSIAGRASDTGSGLANSSDASFTLSTSVPMATETSSAQTDSRVITDVAGNSTTAGPIQGIMVDRKAPGITLTTPSNGASYLLNQPVTASYTITDGGSGVDSSHSGGTVSSGSPIDTGSAGSKSFTVNAQDNVGNPAAQSASYSVGYKIVALYDPTKYAKSGSTIPIKLQLADYNGANVSAAGISVTAQSVTLTGSATSTVPADAGSANPDNNFRYDASLGGYIYNLSTKGLASGTYTLSFTVGGDPTTYTVQFQVR